MLLALWLALAGHAAADGLDPDLASAQRHIEALEYPEAVNVLETLLRRGGSAPEVVIRAYELMATAAASSGEEAQAVWAYERLLALDPRWQPPAQMSPRLSQALERARADLPAGSALSVGLERPLRAARGRPLAVTLVAESDALGLVRGARVYHRPERARSYSRVTVRGGAPVDVLVPASATQSGAAVELWAAALDEHGNEIARVGSEATPARVPLGPAGRATGHANGAGNGRHDETDGPGLFGQWWFWTGVVVVVAGAAVAGVLLAQPEADCPSETACFDVRVESGAWR